MGRLFTVFSVSTIVAVFGTGAFIELHVIPEVELFL
jgi:hypothetical protein